MSPHGTWRTQPCGPLPECPQRTSLSCMTGKVHNLLMAAGLGQDKHHVIKSACTERLQGANAVCLKR
eukprot:scaffold113253_cov19-Tisochrysis_lutea.AAC.2